MEKKAVSGIMLALLLTCLLTLASNIQLVGSEPRTIVVPNDYLTVQEAVNAAGTGDTVIVYGPTYYRENVVVDKSVSLIGVFRPGLASFNVAANNVFIHGFRFRTPWGFPYGRAIVLNGVSGCKISNVTVSGVDESSGIVLTDAPNNVIAYSEIWGNFWGGGIVLERSSNNTIFGNTIDASSESCIYLQDSSDNKFFHNQFYVYNGRQVTVIGSSVNVWDAGYPCGGNYWNDYSGTDFYRGPYQNETGSDEIGDTPYVIDEDNQDHYPLVNPWYPSPTGIEDIAILGVAVSKTVLGQGYGMSINVTLANQGIFKEIFDVAVYVNTTFIASQTLALSGGNATTITFVWDAKGFAKANYTISACEFRLPEETDTADNTYLDGTVAVVTPGDVNADGVVNILDALGISAHWYPGPPKGPLGFGPNFDANSDGAIDIADLAVVSAYWTGPPKGPMAP